VTLTLVDGDLQAALPAPQAVFVDRVHKKLAPLMAEQAGGLALPGLGDFRHQGPA
jgi:hypothetical protein